jgi:hypothetical protein
MSEKKERIKIICYSCDEEFSVYKEPKGVLLIACPFCEVECKVEFEDNSEKVVYKGMKP